MLATAGMEWCSPPVLVAATPAVRWRGLRPWALGWGMLLAGSSVHGGGMVEPLALVGIDRRGVVVSVRTLPPHGLARLDGAAFVLELPATAHLPEPGWALRGYAPGVAGRLILCATPIGNLGDVSGRLAEAISSADVVFAEDTRRTAKLLTALGVSSPLRSYFVGNERRRGAELGERLSRGETVALVTDAGTPAIADPGLTAVRVARSVGAHITMIPGPSAVTAALAVSGMPSDRFVFEGFLPRRGGARDRRLAALAGEERTIVLFSATRRAVEDLADLAAALGDDRQVVVARELTKLHEEVWSGTLAEAAARWGDQAARGEFTLVVAGAESDGGDMGAALVDVVAARSEGAPLSAAVRDAAHRHGVRRRELYELALEAGEAPSPVSEL